MTDNLHVCHERVPGHSDWIVKLNHATHVASDVGAVIDGTAAKAA
ncbi:hypothetical protein [Embleya scabrispora]|nr:hypothetical protein [Embleya scabrispora]